MSILRTSIIAVALVFAIASSSLPASALAPKDAVIECDLNGLLKQLSQVKQDGTTSTAAAELDLRKQLLTRSMDCNARESAALAKTVAGLEGNTRVAQVLKKKYALALEGAAARATEQAKVAGTLQTVSSTKEFAVALKAWRTEEYNPLAWEASQLIILDRNIALAASGAERLNQLHKLVAEVSEVEGAAEVRAELSQAAGLVNDADKKLAEALVLLRDKPKESQEAITVAQKVGLDELSRAYRFLLEGNTRLAALAPIE